MSGKCDAAARATAEYRALVGAAASLVVRWRLSSRSLDALLGCSAGSGEAIVAGRILADPDTEERLRRLVEVDLLARRVLRDDAVVREWVHRPCACLWHRSPLGRMTQEGGLEEVALELRRDLVDGAGI